MKNYKYVFLLAVGFIFFIGCSKQTPITGAEGPTGNTGVPGGNIYGPSNPVSLDAGNFIKKGANLYEWHTIYGAYNPNMNYELTVYAYKVSVLNEDYKLPWIGVWVYNAPFDELYSSMHADTVQIWYYSTTPWPSSMGDSVMEFQYTILPLNQ